MKEVKTPLAVRAQQLYADVERRLPRSRRALLLAGLALGFALSAVVALWNLFSGPLFNLNDIGTYKNRVLFIAMTAAVQVLLHLLLTAMHRGGYARLLLRHALLLAGYVIALLAINQKTYAFVEGLLPLIRQMDAQGLAAIAGMDTNLSSSALTILYAMTRGPVYDMYLLKLACIAAYMALCMSALYAGDRMRIGIRAEALFALCLILPQGFMSAACAAQPDGIAAALLAASLAVTLAKKPRLWLGAILYGLALALSGACLYALPVYAALWLRGKISLAQLLCPLGILLALQIPAILAGQNALLALSSPLRAVLGVPEYAAGAPNIMNIFPRPAMEEMPEYFMLEKLPNIDPVTNFSPFYTQAHFDVLMRGFALLGVGIDMLVFMLLQRRSIGAWAKAFGVALCALLCAPGATAGLWLFACVLALAVIFMEPACRAGASCVLFALMGTAAYPVTGEVLLPLIIAMALCLLALFDLLGMFDANREARA